MLAHPIYHDPKADTDLEKTAKDFLSFSQIDNRITIAGYGCAIKLSKAEHYTYYDRISGMNMLFDPSEYGAVFNASGSEDWGWTFEKGYVDQGILYETMCDIERDGCTLDDPVISPNANPSVLQENVNKEFIKLRADINSILYELPYKGRYNDFRLVKIQKGQYFSDVFARYCFVKAAIFIDYAIRTLPPGKRILVHCMMGLNRSASAIATYYILFKNFQNDPDSVISKIRSNRAFFDHGFLNTALNRFTWVNIIHSIAEKKRNVNDKIIPIINEAWSLQYNSLVARIGAERIRLEKEEEDGARILIEMSAQKPVVGAKLSLIRYPPPEIGSRCYTCGIFDWQIRQKRLPRIQRCSRCKKVTYCSMECQSIDYPTHRDICILKDR